ncbi:ribosome biogenesis GTP-binding protein YihA/YsxC [Mycoplasmopsis synoviae]|uniref:Probable GTP-binding protein EngB n=2 Tax=Mycoplasmopsis synoviae TaxID=2109 RepID=ENGB_MYCS5|nr:ribosome biogenesis GTP-binding protein YihA/YsxC [Mycoplasmopsis synoviae]Q4A5B4.1 RecName: Full=Probable GTP-binding protein EngB [Mycoplasmopsis synoviae 53]AAZ44057.1 putative GTP-binding protein [Mycoplasmopsis synoviae 53]AKB11367.1 GTP-binding protein [Mycoplasmopsis synoviae ATCC 25204]MBD5789009.1 GTP-binding protein YsxC [Mycoplasmopsis synoviae GX11-T]QGL45348.1 YihA family ribosome biogenesis GTP-binding protein [Mycoplasmopsis synoviae]QXV99445.1 ribosome biogenesis GTP-bindin
MFKFVKSSSDYTNWYFHKNSEIAFWGRSNVGKSSLLNALTSKGLAKVSKTPGRTQLINFFENELNQVYVDLPGYGYAKLSKDLKDKMMAMIEEYLLNRSNLKMLYLLIDSRLGFTKIDLEILSFLKENNLNYFIVFTKIDKLNTKEKNELNKKIKTYLEKESFNYLIVSSETKYQIDKLKENINSNF